MRVTSAWDTGFQADVAVVSRDPSVPRSALKAVSRDLDTHKDAHERQDSTDSEVKEISQEPSIGSLERTGLTEGSGMGPPRIQVPNRR